MHERPDRKSRERSHRDDFVGRYRILGELGRGGMGVVYRAVDERLDREVALKSPLPREASEADRQRFFREARAAARVSHPHIVPIYEVFEEGDRLWLAMELVSGRTLRAAVELERRLPLETVLLVGEQLAEALDAVHAVGVLHRDVKPNNIMMTPRGGARLMDFGLAQFLASPVATTGQPSATAMAHGIAGTLGYISPEQILSRPLEPSSDLFSLGAVLYEAATGHCAFSGETPGEIFDATLHLEPPPLSQFVPGAPAELQRIVSKALAKRPDERYQSARELATDLRILRRRLESQHHVPPAVASPSAPRWIAAITVTAVIGAAAAAMWYASRPAPIVLGTPRQLTSGSGWEADPVVGPDGSLVAYVSDQSGNPDIWLLDMATGASLRLTDDPAADGSPAWFPDGTTLAFVSEREETASIWKMSRLGGAPTLLVENARDPAVSPDGSTVAFAREDSAGFFRIAVASLANPQQVQVLTTADDGLWDHREPAWSSDGRTIVYAAWRDLWLVSASGSNARRLTMADASDREPAWSADGRFIYFSSLREGTRALWRVPADGGTPVRLTGGQGPEGQPSLSGNGARLVYSTFIDNADLVLRDLDSGEEQRITGERIEIIPAFAPDDSALAFVSDRWAGRFDLWVQPLRAGRPAGQPLRLTDHPGAVSRPAFSPDGRWIAYYRIVEGQRDIWIVPAHGGAPLQFTDDPAMDVHPDWSPDGSQLVFVSERGAAGEVWVQAIADGQPAGPARQITSGVSSPVVAPKWSPDGSTIAFVGNRDSEIWIVSPADGSPPRKIVTSPGVYRVGWDQSGTLWANGFWGQDRLSLRTIDLSTGAVRVPRTPIVIGSDRFSTDFDISRDRRYVAYSRRELRGDLWVYEAGPKTF